MTKSHKSKNLGLDGGFSVGQKFCVTSSAHTNRIEVFNFFGGFLTLVPSMKKTPLMPEKKEMSEKNIQFECNDKNEKTQLIYVYIFLTYYKTSTYRKI